MQRVISTRTRVISTRRVGFYTQSVISKYTRVILTRVCVNNDTHDRNLYTKSVIPYAESNLHTQSVISTCIRVFSTRKVQLTLAECDFIHRVWFPTHTSVILTRVRLNMTLTSVIDTRRVRFHTQSVISTRSLVSTRANVTRKVRLSRREWFYTQSVVSTHTRVILTRMRVNVTLTSVIKTCTGVSFLHAEYNFHTQSVILHVEYGFHTHTRE
jgi:hypothetical protein